MNIIMGNYIHGVVYFIHGNVGETHCEFLGDSGFLVSVHTHTASGTPNSC